MTGSAIKQSTAAVPTTRNISDALYAEVAVKTTTYSVLTTDHLKTIILDGASADVTFTLPTVGAGDDGLTLWFFNDDPEYVLTVKPADSDTYMYNSGMGYGIDMPDKGTIVKVIYCHSRTQWIVRKEAGGKVMVEGLKLHEPMCGMTLWEPGATTYAQSIDLTGRHNELIVNDVNSQQEESAKFPPGCWNFPGNDEYVLLLDSPDWDIFGDQTGHKTVALWVFANTNPANNQLILAQSNSVYDGDNRMNIYRKATDRTLALILRKAGGTEIYEYAGAIADITWTHIAVIFNGAIVGLYVNGVQVAYDGTWNTLSLTGSLFVGQDADGGNFWDGRMQDLFIAYNNPFNATPNIGVTDDWSANLPAAPMQLVM